MVQLEKLLDAWRADPRVESTVELGNMLLRANVKAKGALPRPFIIAFGDEASRKHPQHMEVLEVLSRLFAVSGEGSRATALYARSALLFPGDPRVVALESALKGDGLAVPPPDVAATQAPPPPAPEPPGPIKKLEARKSEVPPKPPEAPPKRELANPRPLQTSLADFMPPAAGKQSPIEPASGFPIDMEPSTSTGIHTDPTRDLPPHVPEVPTTQLEVAGVEAALGDDASIPKRVRAPTIGGLGLPAPPLPPGATTPALGAPPAAPARVVAGSGPPAPRVRPQTALQGSGATPGDASGVPSHGPETAFAPTQPGPRRSATLVAEHGVAPPALAPPARIKDAPALEPTSPVRMFTPARAFTPPPGNLAWGESVAPPPSPPEETRGEETTQGGDPTTSVIQASARAAAGMMIDSPTTTQETITKPLQTGLAIPTLRGAPSADPPPTQTRLVPHEDQLRAAAASIIARPAGSDGGSRPAARRAGSSPRPQLRFDEDDPPTGVTATATETQVTAPPVAPPSPAAARAPARPSAIPEIPNLGLDLSEEPGQATARRDTSELLAAALLPRAPQGAPALGAPSAAAAPSGDTPPVAARPPTGPGPVPVPVLGPPPALPPPSNQSPPGGVRPPAGGSAPPPPGPVAKPTLVSRTPGPSGPLAKPTLVSPGAKSPARPLAAPLGPLAPPSSGMAPPPARAPVPELDTADETSTKVRPGGPPRGASENVAAPVGSPPGPPRGLPPPPPMAPPAAAAPLPPVAAESSTMSRAITDLWEPRDKRTSSAAFDPRREPDEDGPSTNVINAPPAIHLAAAAAVAAAGGGHPSPAAMAGVTPPVRGIPIVDDPSFAEEISVDSIETVDEPDNDPPTGKVDLPRGKARSTQKIGGTVAPAVVWSPPAQQDDALDGGVRTKVLTAEQSAAAGRVDPLPSNPPSTNDWLITPPPPVAPTFGPPPPSIRPSQIPASMPASQLGPMSVPPSPSMPSMPSIAPGPSPSARPRPPEGDAARPVASRGKGSPSPIIVGSVIGVALSVLVAGGVWLYGLASETKTTTTKTAGATTDVDAIVFGGRREDLDRADAILVGRPPSGQERAYALARAHERALRALELGVAERMAEAIADAKQKGLTDEDIAFLELAKAVADHDGQTEKDLIAKWSDRRKSDAYFLLAAGVSLEQRGDRTAVEKYGAALGAEPRLRPAALRLARAELLDGDSTRGGPRVEGLAAQGAQAPEVLALRGLMWLRGRADDAGKGTPAPSVPDEAALPVELRFIPAAMAIVTTTDASKRRTALEEAAKKADTPSVEVLFGTLAFDLHAEASALEIARSALRRAPEYPPTLSLFARSGLALAKLDTLDEVGKTLPTAQQKLLRAITAYERGDVATVVDVRTWLGQRDEPGREGIVARAERLVGSKPMPPARIQALQRPDVAGGDLVAVDALLDAGDVAAARVVVDKWDDPSSHPLRALRTARLLRYEGKSSEAESALDVAAPTQPALVERVLIEADKADERAHARSMLDARFGEDRFYYEAYLLALDDRMPAARKLLDTLPVPGDEAPLARRVAAALAFGAADEKDRARELVRRLADTWPRNPDVERAKRALDSRPR